MKWYAAVLLGLVLMLVLLAFNRQQVVPPICAVFFDRRDGQMDVLYGISCPPEIDSASAQTMFHKAAQIPPWCDIVGVIAGPDGPDIKAKCERPPE